MFRSTTIDGIRTRLVVPSVVVALLVCHGFFGVFHELPGSASPAHDMAASAPHGDGGMMGHGGGESGPGLPGHLGAADYAAVIALLLAGAALSLLRIARPVWLPPVIGRFAPAPRPPRLVPAFARGPTPPFSQVFRL